MQKQILVVGKDAVEREPFETLKQAICDRLGFRLLIHTDRKMAVQEPKVKELRASDAVVISHDCGDGIEGDEELVNTAGFIRSLGIPIVVLGVSSVIIRRALRKRGVVIRRRELDTIEAGRLTYSLRRMLGIRKCDSETD